MNYAGPDWPVIITVAVIVVVAIAAVVLSSRRLRTSRVAGQGLFAARVLQITAVVIGALGVLWLVASLVGNLSMSIR